MLFSHDGIHDSQTHLASPTYFYDQLRREISLATRTDKPIALIKILFDNPDSDQVRAHDILHFSYELTQLTRQEDCIGRLGVNEVVIIVRDGRGKYFGRSPAVLANLIALGVVSYQVEAHLWFVAIPLTALAGTTLIAALRAIPTNR